MELGASERAVLSVLQATHGRVVSRDRIARLAGLRGVSPRRIDSVIVELRRHLGPDAVRTVRGRGWMLVDRDTP